VRAFENGGYTEADLSKSMQCRALQGFRQIGLSIVTANSKAEPNRMDQRLFHFAVSPKGTDQLEAFIADIETQLIETALDEDTNNEYKPKTRAKEIRDIAKQVSKQDHTIVPTDKTSCKLTITSRKC
jgi:hypothetical protein